MGHSFFFVADAAFEAGRRVGMVMAPLALLFGAVGAIVAMRRPGCSRKALSGLALVLGGWFVFSALGVVAALDPELLRQTPPVFPLLAAFASLGGLCVIVVGVVFALLGLVDTYDAPARYRHGRKRGFLALGFAAVAVGIFAFGFLKGVLNGGAKSGGVFSMLSSNSTAPPQPVVVDEFNYRITPPPGWGALDGKKLNPLASAAFTRIKPPLFAMVLAEHIPVGSEPKPDALAELVKGQLRSANTPNFLAEESVQVKGMDGIRLESEIERTGIKFLFVHWMTALHGNIYQVITWGPVGASQLVRDESARLRNGFELIDEKRIPPPVSPPPSATASSEYRSPVYGWSIDLKGTWWTRRWDSLARSAPSAEWGVMNPAGSACFCIVPLWIGQDEVPLDALTHGFLSRFSIPFPDDSVYGVKDWQDPKQPAVTGRSLGWEGKHNGIEMLYRLRIARTRTCSYLLAAWFVKSSETQANRLEEALDRVRFDHFAPFAVTPEWMKPHEQAAHRLIFNEIGLHFEREHEEALAEPWFKRSYELGRSDPKILTNYVTVASRLGKKQEALKYLEQQIDHFPDDQKLAVTRAYLELDSGDAANGMKSYAQLFDSGYRDDEAFSVFAQTACLHEQSIGAMAALDRYEQGRDSAKLQKLRALIHSYRREFDQSAAILAKLQQAAPDDAEIMVLLADSQLGAKQYETCIATCDRVIEKRPDSAAAWKKKGIAQLALKRYRDAKESMEKAQEKDASNPEIKRWLDQISGLLGQGPNFAVKTEIAPVPAPADLPPPPAPNPADEYLRGFSAYYRYRLQSIQFEPGHERKTTETQAITVLDQQGVQTYSTMEFPYDPLSEEVFVNSLTVKDASGQTVGAARREDSYISDQGAEETASQRKILRVPVPGLQPGSTIELTITRRETGPAKTFTFHPHLFSKSVPILRNTVVLRAPAGAVKWEASPGVESKKLKDAICWSVVRPPVFHLEPMMAPLDQFMPMLWICDARATWASETKEYLDSIKDRLALEPEVRHAAAQAVAGLTKDSDKIAALSRLVQRDLSYKAIEFGRRARIPASAAQTLQRRYGDCKDHALLLSQLLDSVGIPSQLALVSGGMHIRPGLPSIDQFNHMIVYLPSGSGGRFIDCTSKSTDLAGNSPPNGLDTQQALILDADHPRLETIPEFAPGSSTVKVQREITVPEGGSDLSVKESLTFTGLIAASMRASLENVQPAERKRTLLQILSAQLPSLELNDAEIGKLDDPHQPLQVQVRYVVRQKCQTIGGQLIGQIPAPWERMFLAPTVLEKRYTPFRLPAPLTIDSAVTITPPAGWKPSLPEKRQLEKPFCAGALTAHLDQRTLRLESRLDQHAGNFSAAQYGAYREAMAAALGLVEQSVVFVKR